MSELEKFLHDEESHVPLILKAAMAHVQFESIHPFLDGNGRLGRMLVTLLFYKEGALQQPLLYLSLFLKQHREEYYRLLMEVRTGNAWNDWLEFFAEGVRATAEQAVETARRIQPLHEQNRKALSGLGREAATVARMFEQLQRIPAMNLRRAKEVTGLSFPSVSKAMKTLLGKGIVSEITGKQRGQFFVYSEYLKILNEGTEPLTRGA
jgi:Fic family protein